MNEMKYTARKLTKTELYDIYWGVNSFKLTAYMLRTSLGRTRAEASWHEFVQQTWGDEGLPDWEASNLCYGGVVPFTNKEY